MVDKRLSCSISLLGKSGDTKLGHICKGELFSLCLLVETHECHST